MEDQKSKKIKKKPKKANGFKENPTKPKKSDNEDEDDNDDGDDISSSSLKNESVAKINKLMIECLNTTNTNNILECTEYLSKIPIELIEYGLKKASRVTNPSWKYAIKILDDYVRKKFTTIEQVKADELNYQNITKSKGNKKSNFEGRQYKPGDLDFLIQNKGGG